MRPLQLQLTQTPPRALRRRKPPRRPKPPSCVPYKSPPKSTYVESLGLVATSKADTWKEKSKEVDCEIIDLEEDLVPKTPTTPRSAKSLISQLSRDLSPTSINRMSLDFNKDKEVRLGGDSDSDDESAKSENSDDLRPAKAASLLAIDFCSPLGQRVKKNIVADKEKEKPEPVVLHSYEIFCHTPKKNSFVERLRHRQNNQYPVSFRRKRSNYYGHEYKFSRRQRREFMKKSRTGLNRRSRLLKRQMQSCSVVMENMTEEDIRTWREKSGPTIDLTRLSDFEIARWTARRVQEGYVFPGRPSPMLHNGSELQRLLGLRTPGSYHNPPRSRYLSLSQMLSEDTNAEVTQQKLMLYKTLLSEAGNSGLTPPHTPPTHMPQPVFTGYGPNRFYGSSPAMQGGRPVLMPGGGRSNHAHGMSINNTNTLSAMLKESKRRRRSSQSDDVISISSCDSDDNKSTTSTRSRRQANTDKSPPTKKQKISTEDLNSLPQQNKSHAVLFKCHLCYQEILFNLSTTDFIKKHFADKHDVHNIQILEHRDQNNQVVLSIVEDSKYKGPVPVHTPTKRMMGPASRMARQTRSKATSPTDIICID